MGAIRLLIVTVIMGGLAYWLLRTVIQGARTGRVRHTDSVKSCSKTENPLGYWLLMALFAGMAGIAILVWVYVAISVFRPRGVEHRPASAVGYKALLIEPEGVPNTGGVQNHMVIPEVEWV